MIGAKVSIIVPLYNGSVLIVETLNSIIAQTYKNWECLVVDDGSTDNSWTIVKEIEKKQPRIRVFKRPEYLTKGANSCRNFGLELSKGTFINFVDADDLLHENFLSEKVNCFKDNDFDVVISKTCFIEKNSFNPLGYEDRTNLSNDLINDFIQTKVSWYVGDPLWKKSFLIEKELSFDEDLLKGQDRDFHIRALYYKPKIFILNQYLYYYRKTLNSISTDVNQDTILSLFKSNFERFIFLNRNKKLTKQTKLFLLIQQIKLYPHIHKFNSVLSKIVLMFKSTFTLSLQYFKWLFKFCLVYLFLKLTGKGSFLLKG